MHVISFFIKKNLIKKKQKENLISVLHDRNHIFFWGGGRKGLYVGVRRRGKKRPFLLSNRFTLFDLFSYNRTIFFPHPPKKNYDHGNVKQEKKIAWAISHI